MPPSSLPLSLTPFIENRQKEGALIGASVGALASFSVAAAFFIALREACQDLPTDEEHLFCSHNQTQLAFLSTLVTTAAGAALGALTGLWTTQISPSHLSDGSWRTRKLV